MKVNKKLLGLIVVAAMVLGIQSLTQANGNVYDMYFGSSYTIGYATATGPDLMGNSYNYDMAIGGQKYSDHLNINYLRWSDGSSSPTSLVYGYTRLVDSVNSANTIYLTDGGPYGHYLSDFVSTTGNWNPQYATNNYPYVQQDVGTPSFQSGVVTVSRTAYDSFLLIPN